MARSRPGLRPRGAARRGGRLNRAGGMRRVLGRITGARRSARREGGRGRIGGRHGARRRELPERRLVEIERLARLPQEPQCSAGDRQKPRRRRPLPASLAQAPEILERAPGLRPLPRPQRRQGVGHEGRCAGRGRDRRPGEQRVRVERPGPRPERLRPLPADLDDPVLLHRGQVARLPRIPLQVVQLERVSVDQLEAAAADRHARPVAEIVRERHRLGARRQGRHPPLRVEQRHEARPFHRPRRRQSQQVEKGRRQIEETHRLRDGAIPDDEPRDAQQERNAQRRVVQPEAGASLGVLAQPLAVAAGDHHDGGAGDAERGETLQQPADLRIRALQLRVVRVAMPERPRRIGRVRRSRVGQLHPQVEARPEVIVQPGARRVHHVGRRALREPADRRRAIPDAGLVEAIEAARQPGGPPHRRGADEGRGLVARAVQHLRECGGVGRQRRARPQEPRTPDRRSAGHHRQVRRQRLGDRGRRLLETEPLGRQAVEVRRRRQRRVAVRTEAADAQAVDADEHEARLLGDRAVPGAAADALQCRSLERGQAPREGAEEGRDREERQVTQHPDGPGAAGGGAHRSP